MFALRGEHRSTKNKKYLAAAGENPVQKRAMDGL
jgi:hypothetical protein